MQEKIYEMLFEKDDVTWQSLLYELVKKEEMDPWNVDITALTKKYIEIIRELKAHDFRISGKVLLAAAILLRIKSNRLVGEDMLQFDRMLEEPSEIEDVLDTFGESYGKDEEHPSLIPRTPQPRKRKVSIFDLVEALEKALEVKQRRIIQRMPVIMDAPVKVRDISEIIKEIYAKLRQVFLSNKVTSIRFSQLVPGESREDKVYTFIPLLHLSNQRKVELNQEMHFGEIDIALRDELKNPA
ncbi:segregation/condensation protein A [Candidatus Woesearchaeota archaeon]|nr:segregation/condensation protein A [Candidatus Woesearchaeota archaeon]